MKIKGKDIIYWMIALQIIVVVNFLCIATVTLMSGVLDIQVNENEYRTINILIGIILTTIDGCIIYISIKKYLKNKNDTIKIKNN